MLVIYSRRHSRQLGAANEAQPADRLPDGRRLFEWQSVEPGDPFYDDFQRFMGIVTYGRAAGEHWPKLNLLETMGVIISESHELEYLKKILPPYARSLPDYRVELQLNDSVVKVLQTARAGTRRRCVSGSSIRRSG